MITAAWKPYLHAKLGGWGSGGLAAYEPEAVAEYERHFAKPEWPVTHNLIHNTPYSGLTVSGRTGWTSETDATVRAREVKLPAYDVSIRGQMVRVDVVALENDPELYAYVRTKHPGIFVD